MWIYQQSTGRLVHDGELIAVGYSGAGAGLNNPDMQHVRNVGPIPAGEWVIGREFVHAVKGPVCMRLSPVGHDALGRNGFMIHGDNKNGNKSASLGCIILSKPIRTLISKSKDAALLVTP